MGAQTGRPPVTASFSTDAAAKQSRQQDTKQNRPNIQTC
jgi:hypothetical protein